MTSQSLEGKTMGFKLVERLKSVGPASGLSAPEMFVLMLLATYIQDRNPGRGCWPSVHTLAEQSRLGERTVQRALRGLEAKGWLTVVRAQGQSSRYEIRFKTPVTVTPPPPSQRHPYPRHSGTLTGKGTGKGTGNTKKRASPAPPAASPPGVIRGEASRRVKSLVDAWNSVAASDSHYRKVDRTTDALLSAIHRNASLTAETLRELMTQARGPRTFVRFLWDSY